jgi:hypothetical protein
MDTDTDMDTDMDKDKTWTRTSGMAMDIRGKDNKLLWSLYR